MAFLAGVAFFAGAAFLAGAAFAAAGAALVAAGLVDAAFVAAAVLAALAAFRPGGTLLAGRADDAGSAGGVASPGAAVAVASAALDRARDAAVLPAGVGLLMGMSGPFRWGVPLVREHGQVARIERMCAVLNGGTSYAVPFCARARIRAPTGDPVGALTQPLLGSVLLRVLLAGSGRVRRGGSALAGNLGAGRR